MHGVAEASLSSVAFGMNLVQGWPTYLTWLALTTGFYHLIGRHFPTPAARRQCVLGFIVGFPMAMMVVRFVAVVTLFIVAVIKFGFV